METKKDKAVQKEIVRGDRKKKEVETYRLIQSDRKTERKW
jgi:hypothetical protein